MNLAWVRTGGRYLPRKDIGQPESRKGKNTGRKQKVHPKHPFCQFQIISHIPFQLDRDGGSLRKVTLWVAPPLCCLSRSDFRPNIVLLYFSNSQLFWFRWMGERNIHIMMTLCKCFSFWPSHHHHHHCNHHRTAFWNLWYDFEANSALAFICLNSKIIIIVITTVFIIFNVIISDLLLKFLDGLFSKFSSGFGLLQLCRQGLDLLLVAYLKIFVW